MSKSFNYWQLSLAFVASAAVIMLPDMLLAADVSAFESALCTIASWFSSGVGKALATVGVTIIGIGALLGKVSWGMALIVGLGVAVVFGAGSLVDALTGTSESCNADIIDGANSGINPRSSGTGGTGTR